MTAMEFEGKTEREAIAKAAAELGSESFDVEILEKTGGIFGKGKVRIRVRTLDTIPDPMGPGNSGTNRSAAKIKNDRAAMDPKPPISPSAEEEEEPEEPVDPPSEEIKESLIAFAEGIIERMGYSGKVAFKEMDKSKAVFEITSDSSNILIGKKGKNLDALQLLLNVYLNRVAGDDAPWRIVLDTEGYRARREESLVRMAHRAADEAARTRSSRLLEPMNPFERRLIHTAINERDDVVTKSEGEGLYKRVRIMAKGAPRGRSRGRR